MLIAVSLDDIIRICEDLKEEEQFQSNQLLQKYKHLFDEALDEFSIEPISLH
jgi:hypothetical protein